MNLQREGCPANESPPPPISIRQVREIDYSNDRHDPPALSLDDRGMIQDCSKSFERLFGFQRPELVWRHISRLFPQLEHIELVQAGQLNPLLNYLCHCGHLYQVLNQQGDIFLSHLSFVRIEFNGKRYLRLILHPSETVRA